MSYESTSDQSTRDVLAVLGFIGAIFALLFFVEPVPSKQLFSTVLDGVDGKLGTKEAAALLGVFWLTIPLTGSVIVAGLFLAYRYRANGDLFKEDLLVVAVIAVIGFVVGNALAASIDAPVAPLTATAVDIRRYIHGNAEMMAMGAIGILVSNYFVVYGPVLAIASLVLGAALTWGVIRKGWI